MAAVRPAAPSSILQFHSGSSNEKTYEKKKDHLHSDGVRVGRGEQGMGMRGRTCTMARLYCGHMTKALSALHETALITSRHVQMRSICSEATLRMQRRFCDADATKTPSTGGGMKIYLNFG